MITPNETSPAYRWIDEAEFIRRAAIDANDGKVSGNFNNSVECFRAYCNMQESAAEQAGCHEQADSIRVARDSLAVQQKGESK